MAAINLHKIGITKGDRIGFATKNHTKLAPIVFAALSIAAPLSTLDPNFNCDEMMHTLRLTQPKLMFCEFSNIDVVRSALAQLQLPIPVYTFGGTAAGAHSVEDLFAPCENEDLFT